MYVPHHRPSRKMVVVSNHLFALSSMIFFSPDPTSLYFKVRKSGRIRSMLLHFQETGVSFARTCSMLHLNEFKSIISLSINVAVFGVGHAIRDTLYFVRNISYGSSKPSEREWTVVGINLPNTGRINDTVHRPARPKVPARTLKRFGLC